MNFPRFLLLPIIASCIFSLCFSAFAENKKQKEWTGKLKDGTILSKTDLDKIINQQKKWVLSRYKNNKKGKPANLAGAHLSSANLQGVLFLNANLQRIDLSEANLRGAFLLKVNLQGADLSMADLHGASLHNTNLEGANLWLANLQDVTFELTPGSLPYIPTIAQALHLSQLKYTTLPSSLVELRNKFKEYGLRKQEREITYAIKKSGYEIAMNRKGDYKTKAEVLAGRILFDLPCKWGMEPERPLIILVLLIGIFSIPYAYSLSTARKTDGIWQNWSSGRMRKDLGSNKPRLIRLHGPKIILVALYFSLLSAFNIGWREINVGNWIARIQPREYTLHASGWVRCVSGIQSLVSVYLLALWFLTYFGRPFESY